MNVARSIQEGLEREASLVAWLAANAGQPLALKTAGIGVGGRGEWQLRRDWLNDYPPTATPQADRHGTVPADPADQKRLVARVLEHCTFDGPVKIECGPHQPGTEANEIQLRRGRVSWFTKPAIAQEPGLDDGY